MAAITLTVIANITSNFGEGLGNISSIQKIYKNGRQYAIRSKESLKNAVCTQSGLYDDLIATNNGAAQKFADSSVNAATNKALEGGYLSTGDITYKRNSSFYFTDAVSAEPFINETRFHNNLMLAEKYAQANGKSVQNKNDSTGLMPYQYEFDKTLKIYSLTIDLDMVGRDDNFNANADVEEKISRVNALLDTVENLSLVVKGSLDNAEPIFVVGGISKRKTHLFENAVRISGTKLLVAPIKEKLDDNFYTGMIRNSQFSNEDEIVKELSPLSKSEFFAKLKKDAENYLRTL